MESNWAFVIWPSIFMAVAFFLVLKKINNNMIQGRRRPPGPSGWPLVGNIFDLSPNVHLSLAKLSNKYGPIMWLQLGTQNTLVVSSAQVAMELFKKHDLVISDRLVPETAKADDYHQVSMALAPYGTYWRMMRRVFTTELFTNNRINATEESRTKSLDNIIRLIWKHAQEKGSVEVTKFIEFMSLNAIGNAIFSKDIADPQSNKGSEFITLTEETIKVAVMPNVASFFPWLRPFDPQGLKKKMGQIMENTINFVSTLVKERVLDRQNGKINVRKDFLDVMLDVQGIEIDGKTTNLPEKSINVGILELLQGATDTSASTIEWALTELLRNPSAMRKVEAELYQVVGQNKKVEEGDIKNLPYLHAVVKETLRLHPAIPLLIPRRVREDIEFMGYSIPKDTQVFVNVWAIARDPTSWDDPLSFKPERFLSSDIDYKGLHFQLLPFGAGRRMCVGLPLAQRILHLTLGSLIHSFEWALGDGTTPEEISLEESFGLTLRKADPLKVVLKLRGMQENVA